MEIGNIPNNKSHIENKILNIQSILSATEIVLSIFTAVFQREMPWWLFRGILISVFVLFGIMCTLTVCDFLSLRNTYKSAKAKLDKRAAMYEEEQTKYGYNVAVLKQNYINRIKKRMKPRMIKCVVVVFAVVLMCVMNPNNAKAFGKDIIRLYSIDESNTQVIEKLPDKQETYTEANEESDDVYKQEEAKIEPELKPKGYRFILQNVGQQFELEDEIRNKVFFYNEENEIVLQGHLSWYYDMVFKYKKAEVDLSIVKDKLGDAYIDCEEKERVFKERVASTYYLTYLSDWIQEAPRSTELDEWINGRLNANVVEAEGKCGSPKLWWRLANDYQYYAQEYEVQTNNGQAILYYYAMSIYCCSEALQYDMEENEYQIIFNYMKTRYQDISRKESQVDEKYKSRAAEILKELNKYEILH